MSQHEIEEADEKDEVEVLEECLKLLPRNGTQTILNARLDLERALRVARERAATTGPIITTPTRYSYRAVARKGLVQVESRQMGSKEWKELSSAPRVLRAIREAVIRGPGEISDLFWSGCISNT